MAARLRPIALDRQGWLGKPEEQDSEQERRAELRERWLMIAAAVAIGVLNIIIVVAAVWHPASTFELSPLLPK